MKIISHFSQEDIEVGESTYEMAVEKVEAIYVTSTEDDEDDLKSTSSSSSRAGSITTKDSNAKSKSNEVSRENIEVPNNKDNNINLQNLRKINSVKANLSEIIEKTTTNSAKDLEVPSSKYKIAERDDVDDTTIDDQFSQTNYFENSPNIIDKNVDVNHQICKHVFFGIILS